MITALYLSFFPFVFLSFGQHLFLLKKFYNFIRQVARVIKFALGMFTYIAHFDQKVGIYIATKLFQFASRKELYAILAGPDVFSGPGRAIACSHHIGI